MALENLTDATADTSTDEIKSYADSIAQEVEAERQGETKTDAQIVNDVASIENTSAEKKSSSESVEELDQDEKSGDESSLPKWMNDDTKAEVAAYGISESDLSDFANREELDRALRLLDKTALEAGRKAAGEPDKDRNGKGQFAKKELPKTSEEETPKNSKYEVALNKDEYDDEIVNEFTRMRDHYESRIEALESHFKEASAKEEEHRFDAVIDGLGMPKLFGSSGKETPDELQKREDVFAQAKVLQAGYRSFGKEVSLESLVGRAAPMVFASEFEKQKLKQHTQKISKQSQLRQGGSPTKPLPVRDNPRDEADRLYQELERA